MRLQAKVTIFALISVVMVVSLAAISLWAFNSELRQVSAIRTIADITQRHMEGDMMHDAMRADVLAARLAASKGDIAAMRRASREFQAHYERFKENLEANLKEDLPWQMQDFVLDAERLLEEYRQAGERAMAASLQQVNGLGEDSAELEAFERSFAALEKDNALIADEISIWANTEERNAERVAHDAKLLLWSISVLAVLFSLAVPLYERKALFKPISEMLAVMRRLAGGDYELNVPGLVRKDEIGEMAAAIEVFRESGREKMMLRQKQKEAEARAKEEQQKAMEQLAIAFEERVQNIVQGVASAATQMHSIAATMNSEVQQVSTNAQAMTGVVGAASVNVRSVASAAEEMSASTQNISEQMQKTYEVVSDAVARSDEAMRLREALSDATESVSQVVKLITDIAGQINLLALNATIESARAGEAGKGFAVVASEVKNLATQTANATLSIGEKIETIQQVSGTVVETLAVIRKAVQRIDEFSGGIATAVEQQSAVTKDISGNMQATSGGMSDISQRLEQVALSSGQASSAADHVLGAAKELSRSAEDLSVHVSGFLQEIRKGQAA